MLSVQKVSPEHLSCLYNFSDCTINISDAEGFGLATLESLACETPIIVTMTGGLQEQVVNEDQWFGIGIEPTSKSIIGSQEVPWIYEDRISKEDFLSALKKMLFMKEEERMEMGAQGRAHVLANYNFQNYVKQWDETLTMVHDEFGSWDTRKGYKSWRIIEAV